MGKHFGRDIYFVVRGEASGRGIRDLHLGRRDHG